MSKRTEEAIARAGSLDRIEKLLNDVEVVVQTCHKELSQVAGFTAQESTCIIHIEDARRHVKKALDILTNL